MSNKNPLLVNDKKLLQEPRKKTKTKKQYRYITKLSS